VAAKRIEVPAARIAEDQDPRMQLTLPIGDEGLTREFYLDGLVVETILSHLRGLDLANVGLVCRSLLFPADAVAHRALLATAAGLECHRLRQFERGSWVAQLIQWERLVDANMLWLQASPEFLTVSGAPGGDPDGAKQVTRCRDRTGNGNHAASPRDGPVFNPLAINGLGAFEFDCASVLKTRPFDEPISQPVTLMVSNRL